MNYEKRINELERLSEIYFGNRVTVVFRNGERKLMPIDVLIHEIQSNSEIISVEGWSAGNGFLPDLIDDMLKGELCE